jgi:transposase
LGLGIRDVAMEATGVYWIPVYEALGSRGLRVALVDARSAKALPGRKTDVQDCQWIRDLHMHGMLNSCVVPDAQILVLRSYWRQRERLIRQRSEQTQLMHKALEQMNIQLHKVLSDVTGVSGMAIIRGIMAGERNPKVLSELLVHRARLKKDLVEKALEGRWAAHHLFALEEAVSTYDFLESRLQMCDRRLDDEMSKLGGGVSGSRRPPDASKNAPNFDLKARVKDLLGVDPTVIDGIEASTAAVLVCELGSDLSRFKTKKHLASYLGLAPQNKITGGNIKSSRTKKVTHRAANALRLAAQSLHSSNTALGAYYRRLKARIGAAKAVTACARKIAEAYYELVVNGVAYKDVGEQAYNERFREQRIRSLKKQAGKYGMLLVEDLTPTP